jgi:hypothetical protein
VLLCREAVNVASYFGRFFVRLSRSSAHKFSERYYTVSVLVHTTLYTRCHNPVHFFHFTYLCTKEGSNQKGGGREVLGFDQKFFNYSAVIKILLMGQLN